MKVMVTTRVVAALTIRLLIAVKIWLLNMWIQSSLLFVLTLLE